MVGAVALLAVVCVVLLPRGGESAGGIVPLRQPKEVQEPGTLAGEESLDDPETDGGPVIARRSKRLTGEAALPGMMTLVLTL